MTESEGKTLAERYCSGAEHCSQEVRALLERHNAEKEDIERIIGHLVKEVMLTNCVMHVLLCMTRSGLPNGAD